MLLALWSDFWNPAAWLPAPPPELPDGGSRGAGHGDLDGDDYAQYPAIPDSADEGYWHEREVNLRRNIPVDRDIPDKSQPKDENHPVQPDQIIVAGPHIQASNLLNLSKKLDDLTLQIKRLESDSDDEAIIALLLS